MRHLFIFFITWQEISREISNMRMCSVPNSLRYINIMSVGIQTKNELGLLYYMSDILVRIQMIL